MYPNDKNFDVRTFRRARNCRWFAGRSGAISAPRDRIHERLPERVRRWSKDVQLHGHLRRPPALSHDDGDFDDRWRRTASIADRPERINLCDQHARPRHVLLDALSLLVLPKRGVVRRVELQLRRFVAEDWASRSRRLLIAGTAWRDSSNSQYREHATEGCAHGFDG
jgi:hypothetical protein